MKHINAAVSDRKKFILWVTLCAIAGLVIFLLGHESAFAGTDDLQTVSNRIKDNVKAVASLLVIISYVAGVGFTLAGVVQFKAHKDNPAQVPLSKPIVYLCIGAFLIFLPQLLKTAGKTIFDTTENSAATGNSGLESP